MDINLHKIPEWIILNNKIVKHIDDQKDIGKNFIKNYKDFNNSSRTISEKFLNKMGFTKYDAESFQFRDFPYLVKPLCGDKEEGYIIIDKNTGINIKDNKHNGYYHNYLVSDFAELTGYYLGIPDEYQKKIEIMENLSGMYVLEDIYDELTKGSTRASVAPTEKTLKELGFIYDPDKKGNYDKDRMFYHPDIEDKSCYVSAAVYGSSKYFDKNVHDKNYGDYIRSAYELADKLKNKYGISLDLINLAKESSHSLDFDKLQNLLRDYSDNIKIGKAKKEELLNSFKNDSISQYDNDFLETLLYDRHPLNFRDNSTFSKWRYFKDLYESSVLDGSVKKDYCDWITASNNMYSMNIFFFPAMNGEQHGNDYASRRLIKKSLEIIEERIKKFKEENEDYDDHYENDHGYHGYL
jgi:hypothetical protein